MLFLHWFLLTWHLAKFPHYVYIALGTVQVQSEQSTVLDRESISNLYQLLWFLARKDPAFDSWLRGKIIYTSQEYQNELIEIMGCMVLGKLSKTYKQICTISSWSMSLPTARIKNWLFSVSGEKVINIYVHRVFKPILLHFYSIIQASHSNSDASQ